MGLFDITGFESANDDDIMHMNVNSYTEDVDSGYDDDIDSLFEATREDKEFEKDWKSFINSFNAYMKYKESFSENIMERKKYQLEDKFERLQNKYYKIPCRTRDFSAINDCSFGAVSFKDLFTAMKAHYKEYNIVTAENLTDYIQFDNSKGTDQSVRKYIAKRKRAGIPEDDLANRKSGRLLFDESSEFGLGSYATNDIDNGEKYTNISVPSKTELDSETYNQALANLKKSFKESIDVLSMLENSTIVESSSSNLLNDVIGDAIYESSMNGVIFESVTNKDKHNIEDIVDKIKKPFQKYIEDEIDTDFHEPKETLKIIISLLVTPVGTLHWFSTRLWQMVGIIGMEEANINKVIDAFNDEHAEELGDYKLIAVKVFSHRVTLCNKFGWKNHKKGYLIIVDKKLPIDYKKNIKEIDDALKKAEDEKADN